MSCGESRRFKLGGRGVRGKRKRACEREEEVHTVICEEEMVRRSLCTVLL